MTRVPYLSVVPVGASYLTVSAEVGGSSQGAPAYSGAALVLQPEAPAESAGKLLNVHVWPSPLLSGPFGLGWGLRIGLSEFPGDAAATTAGLGTTL